MLSIRINHKAKPVPVAPVYWTGEEEKEPITINGDYLIEPPTAPLPTNKILSDFEVDAITNNKLPSELIKKT
jgi:hypothetical protein